MSVTFEHHTCYLTARIAATTSTGIGTIGTGFLYRVEFPGTGRFSLLLISNRHVLSDPAGTVTVSFNRKTAKDRPDFGNVKEFVWGPNLTPNYFAHPDEDVDLACLNVSSVAEEPIFYKTLSDLFLEPVDLSALAPSTAVQFVGYPDGRFDIRNNLPLIRTGSVASLPEVDFNGKPHIVIDAQVFPGSSGSPVFVAVGAQMRLLGVVSETMIRYNELQTITTGTAVGVQQMLGLGLVIKQAKVRELIEHVSAAVGQILSLERRPRCA